jgi:hypothetical protein
LVIIFNKYIIKILFDNIFICKIKFDVSLKIVNYYDKMSSIMEIFGITLVIIISAIILSPILIIPYMIPMMPFLYLFPSLLNKNDFRTWLIKKKWLNVKYVHGREFSWNFGKWLWDVEPVTREELSWNF